MIIAWLVGDAHWRVMEFGGVSFFLTSAPLNVHGGVASPLNALAVV